MTRYICSQVNLQTGQGGGNGNHTFLNFFERFDQYAVYPFDTHY